MPVRCLAEALICIALLSGCREAGVESDSLSIPADAKVQEAEQEPTADLSSPLRALGHYLTSLQNEDLAGVQRAMLDAEDFQLSGPFRLDSFVVVRYDTLTAAQAAEYEFSPAPAAGDVELDVREHVAGYGERMYTYNLREIDGAWRIYSHSMWGHDVFDEDDL